MESAGRATRGPKLSVAGHKVFPAWAVYSATKYAVCAISEGLCQESNGEIRVTNVSHGAVATGLSKTISDKQTGENADAIARAIVYAIEQPDDVDVNELIIRSTRRDLQAGLPDFNGDNTVARIDQRFPRAYPQCAFARRMQRCTTRRP